MDLQQLSKEWKLSYKLFLQLKQQYTAICQLVKTIELQFRRLAKNQSEDPKEEMTSIEHINHTMNLLKEQLPENVYADFEEFRKLQIRAFQLKQQVTDMECKFIYVAMNNNIPVNKSI